MGGLVGTAAVPPRPTPLSFIGFFYVMPMVWDIPLDGLGQLSWFCPSQLLVYSQPLSLVGAVWEVQKLKHFWLHTVMLSKN